MSFSNDVNKFTKKADDNINKVFRGTVLSLFTRIIVGTPVGNPSLWKGKAPPNYTGGRLRGNWQVQINSIPRGTVNGKGVPKINGIVSRLKNGQSIFLVNNLPYAFAIENGHSTQRPKGWVRTNILKYKSLIKAQARKMK